MRTLGIDLGAKRVGIAISDESGTLATPVEVVKVTSAEQATRRVVEIVRHEGVKRIVVGLPLNMDDSVGPAARATLAWGKQLAALIRLPLVFVDERLSSFEAE